MHIIMLTKITSSLLQLFIAVQLVYHCLKILKASLKKGVGQLAPVQFFQCCYNSAAVPIMTNSLINETVGHREKKGQASYRDEANICVYYIHTQVQKMYTVQ